MIVDGKEVAFDLRSALRKSITAFGKRLSLGIIVVRETAPIRTFIEQKKRVAQELGVGIDILTLGPLEQKTEHLLHLLMHSTKEHDGVVLQLPLPANFELESILKLFPITHDVDVLGYTAFQQFKEGNLPILPPVVGAIAEILQRHGVRIQGKKTLVIGEGHLVGEPVAIWARQLGAQVSTVNAGTPDVVAHTRDADVIISGTGVPGLITPDMVKDGVVLLDAGTSEIAGALRGDIDPACGGKALLFTPTPGGIGPVTVAKLFENMLTLAKLRKRTSI
jgi:methylenetetrahydrofolate dehydrogenase (NADP+)/methenyltetrahydrofolate cyclohydrolase